MKSLLLAGSVGLVCTFASVSELRAEEPALPEGDATPPAAESTFEADPAVVLAANSTVTEPTDAAPAAEVFHDFGGVQLLGNDRHYIEIGVGIYDLLTEEAGSKRSLGGSLELRIGDKLGFIGPAVGAVFNADGGVYGYGGIYMDVKFGDFVLTPQAAIGAYHQGDSSDLGGVFQFRVGAGLTYMFDNGVRLGISFAHISNAGIYEDNGGVEELYLIASFPFSL
ncbi:Lipid A 3-O-deacylase-related protein (modular protein) [uncultured Defluviicoccus sp.]|uniref:Lipid A 3-O-deacylase-related protein (Modular protein) n=1 Tax=metagenome TaxID=256318 RepID=A0A380TA21_9ZZZZ|nr:Lipid A 3-O-deacylase-related protein (modular protein) [uncultured Defluviicoccus sp.]